MFMKRDQEHHKTLKEVLFSLNLLERVKKTRCKMICTLYDFAYIESKNL